MQALQICRAPHATAGVGHLLPKALAGEQGALKMQKFLLLPQDGFPLPHSSWFAPGYIKVFLPCLYPDSAAGYCKGNGIAWTKQNWPLTAVRRAVMLSGLYPFILGLYRTY